MGISFFEAQRNAVEKHEEMGKRLVAHDRGSAPPKIKEDPKPKEGQPSVDLPDALKKFAKPKGKKGNK